MRAVVIQQPGTVSICDVAEPEVQPGWALVRPRLVGICGSDLHAYTGHSPLVAYPVTPGHEFVGEVIALGDELADPRWPAGRRPPQQILPGARVVADPSVPCGRCEPCRTGHYNTCENQRVLGVHLPGAMADLVLARVDCCLIVPDCLSDEIAALCEPLSIALNACDRTAVTRDDRVAILGAGPVGLACLLHCKLRGCRVAVVEALQWRRELAAELGADLVTTPAEAPEALAAATARPTVVIEASGAEEAAALALSVASHAGRVVMLGFWPRHISLPATEVTRKELSVFGSRLHRGTMPRALALLSAGLLDPKPLLSAVEPLERAPEIIRALAERKLEAVKVLLRI